MSFRSRCLLVPMIALFSSAGCCTPWWKKPSGNCPPPLPAGSPIIAPAPGGFSAPTPAPRGDVLMPAPLPPTGAPAPPPPSFPAPGASNFPPIASFYPPAEKAEGAAPKIRLLAPESAAAGAPAVSESASSPAASLPVGIQEFASAIADRVANGRKPSLDGLDWLKANGYKAVLFIHRPETSDAGDRRQVEQRGLKFLSLEVDPGTLTLATVESFSRVIADSATQPLFVYDMDGSLTGGMWYLYYRQIERLPDEAAKVRAGRLGWRETVTEGGQRDMADAVRKLMTPS